jgi:hypothetical protein
MNDKNAGLAPEGRNTLPSNGPLSLDLRQETNRQPAEGRGRGLLKLAYTITLLALLAVVACGGKALGVEDGGTGGGSGGSGSSAGAGEGGGGAPNDAALPFPDSSQCDMQPATGAPAPCVLCSDEKWHCGSGAFISCPSGAAKGAACTINGGDSCVACNGAGTGAMFTCIDERWNPDPDVTCN